MAIDIATDELISLSQAAKCRPTPPSPATLWRWHRKGIRGIRLETVLIGGKRYTTAEEFAAFCSRVTAADSSTTDERSDAVRRRLEVRGLLDDGKSAGIP
jgi:hypothetical protein